MKEGECLKSHMFYMYLYYIVSLIISLLLEESMSVGCVLAFIRTWTSVSVNVGWNSWANNMVGYGLKDWSLSLFCARLAIGLTCSFIYWTLDCEAGHLPVVWKWSFTASLQYIFEACCLITGAIFSLHLHYVCVYIISFKTQIWDSFWFFIFL
jgi:hypothetical protein